MITDEIKEIIKELFNATPSDVGVGYGTKIKNGEMTNEESIIFFVPKKIPSHLIPENELLPDVEFTLSDRVLKTDVIEVGIIKTFACDPSCYTWSSPSTPPTNRLQHRPIKGGISISSKSKLPPPGGVSPVSSLLPWGASVMGTLGFIAVDTATQALVGVTNNHVVIRDASYTSQRNPSGLIENEYDIIIGGSVDPDLVYQTGEFNPPGSTAMIGQVVRYVPISASGGVNRVDGALISVESSPVIDIAQSFKQFGLSANTPYDFATTAEINNLLITNPMLFSSGRTTGVKQGLPCPLRTFTLGATLPVTPYNIQGTPTTITFTDIIGFVRPENDPSLATVCNWPIYPGDSGSALVADFSGTSKIVGLVFAGSEFYGYACRIDHVASELGIQSWDGTNKPYVDPTTITYITVPGFNSDITQVSGGDTYWQVGAYNLTVPCDISPTPTKTLTPTPTPTTTCCQTWTYYGGQFGTGSTISYVSCQGVTILLPVPTFQTGTICAISTSVISGSGSVTLFDPRCECTPSASPTPTVTPTLTPTPGLSPSVTPTKTLTPTVTVTKTLTPTLTTTPTKTPGLSPSVTPTKTLTPTVTKTKTPTPTVTKTLTPTPTKTPTPTPASAAVGPFTSFVTFGPYNCP